MRPVSLSLPCTDAGLVLITSSRAELQLPGGNQTWTKKSLGGPSGFCWAPWAPLLLDCGLSSLSRPPDSRNAQSQAFTHSGSQASRLPSPHNPTLFFSSNPQLRRCHSLCLCAHHPCLLTCKAGRDRSLSPWRATRQIPQEPRHESTVLFVGLARPSFNPSHPSTQRTRAELAERPQVSVPPRHSGECAASRGLDLRPPRAASRPPASLPPRPAERRHGRPGHGTGALQAHRVSDTEPADAAAAISGPDPIATSEERGRRREMQP